MDMVELVVNTTRDLAIEAVRRVGKDKVDLEVLSARLKVLVRDGWDTIIADGKALLETNASGAMIKAMVCAQCASMAHKAVAQAMK